ncbi:MAG: carboxypeptidase-like regulatory domain-containing protein [Candidatus Zixiibacteriota bacterium]
MHSNLVINRLSMLLVLTAILSSCSGEKQSTIEGRVTDAARKPVGGAVVRANGINVLKGHESCESTTDESGVFTIAGLSPQWSYELTASGENWTCGTRDTIESGPHGQTLVLREPFVLSMAMTLNGSLVDVHTGKRRFVRSDIGIIHDSETNIEWYTFASAVMDYSKASREVQSCSIGGGRWKMPSFEELENLRIEGLGTFNLDPVFGNLAGAPKCGWWAVDATGYVWATEEKNTGLDVLQSAFNFIDEKGKVNFSSGAVEQRCELHCFAVRSDASKQQAVVPPGYSLQNNSSVDDQQKSAELSYFKGSASYESRNYEAAIREFETAFSKGLTGKHLEDAYRMMYFMYSRREEPGKMAHYEIKYQDLTDPETKHAMVAVLCDVCTEDDQSRDDIYIEIPNCVSGPYMSRMKPIYRYHVVAAGPTLITFNKFEYDTGVIEIDLAPGELLLLTDPVVLKRTTDEMQYVKVSGRILEALGETPLDSVEVIFYHRPAGPRLSTVTRPDGYFRSFSIPQGSYWIYCHSQSHVTPTVKQEFREAESTLQDVLMYRLKEVRLRYAVSTSGDPSRFNPNDSGTELTLKTRPGWLEEAKCGFNFLERQVTGSWFSKAGTSLPPPHMFVRQDGPVAVLGASRCSMAALGDLPWDSVRDGKMYHTEETEEMLPIKTGDVFLFNIGDGSRFAKVEILGIAYRQDIPKE